jgi:hypothetical protein
MPMPDDALAPAAPARLERWAPPPGVRDPVHGTDAPRGPGFDAAAQAAPAARPEAAQAAPAAQPPQAAAAGDEPDHAPAEVVSDDDQASAAPQPQRSGYAPDVAGVIASFVRGADLRPLSATEIADLRAAQTWQLGPNTGFFGLMAAMLVPRILENDQWRAYTWTVVEHVWAFATKLWDKLLDWMGWGDEPTPAAAEAPAEAATPEPIDWPPKGNAAAARAAPSARAQRWLATLTVAERAELQGLPASRLDELAEAWLGAMEAAA